MFEATTKTKPDPERFLVKLYNRGCNKAGEKYLYVKKQHFSMLCFGKNEIKSGQNIIFFCYTSYLKVLPLSFQEHFFSSSIKQKM